MDVDLLRRMAVSPGEYRKHLLIDCGGTPRPLDQVLDPFQRQDFEAMDGAWQAMAGLAVPEPEHTRAWIERHRGASKTQNAAVAALWAIAFGQRMVRGVAVAADADQAAILRDAMDRLLRLNPWLGEVVAVQRWKVSNIRTGSELGVLAADERSSYGLLIDFAVVDEVSVWPQDSMWISILSAIAKKPNALLLAIMNAGWRSSWVFQTREKVMQDPAWYFSHQTGRATWISDKQIDEQRRLLPPVQFARLWRNEWSTAEGLAFGEDELRRLIVHEGPAYYRPAEYGGAGIGVDIGTTHHHSAVVTVLTDHVNNRVRVAECVDLSPPVCLGDVRSAILQARRTFRANVVYYDPYQAIAVIQECEAAGMTVVPVHPSGSGVQSRMGVSLLEAVRNRTLELYPDPLLLEDLLGCQIVERPAGLRVELATNEHGHSDRLAALLQVLPFAAEAAAEPVVQYVPDGLGDNIFGPRGYGGDLDF